MLDKTESRHSQKSGFDEQQASLSLVEIASFLGSYATSIAIFVAAPLAIAVAYIFLAAPTYTAMVQLLLEPKTPQPISQNVGADGSSLDTPYVESQVAVLKSEKIILAVIDELKLLDDTDFLESIRSTPVGEGEKSAERYVLSRRVVGAIQRDLDVRRSSMSYAISVSYSSRNPRKAAEIANSIANAFLTDQVQTRSEAVRVGSEWLEARIDQLRLEMNAAALRVQQFRAKRDYRILQRDSRPADGADQPTGPLGNRRPVDEPVPAEASRPETLEELESTASTYRRIYESYLQAYTESLQRESLRLTNARIITLATPPLAPSAPKKALIIAFAILLGLVLGVGQALLRFQFSRQ